MIAIRVSTAQGLEERDYEFKLDFFAEIDPEVRILSYAI